MYLVANVSYSKQMKGRIDPLPLELQIVQDADRLDAIGAVGIARCFTFGGSKDRPLYFSETENNTKRIIVNGGISGVDHFHDKLLRLKNLMNTSAGKKEAEKRHEFLVLFLDQLASEIQ